MNLRVAHPELTDRLSACCHCGGVAFTLPAVRYKVIACHCTDCRTMHGNYNPMIAVPRDAITMLEDATLTWYDSSPGVRRGFCSKCGSRLFKDKPFCDHIMVSAGAVLGPLKARITANDYPASKGSWYDLPKVKP